MNSSPIIKVLSFSLILFLTACGGKNAEPVVEKPVSEFAKRAQNIEIIRDDFGVPHIYAKTDADAVFGLLYAQAEDDFPRIERNYIWATGRLAEIEGEEALYSDLRARLYMTTNEAIAAYESAPEWVKVLCRSFADGLNYYLETHPDVKPKLITHFEPWMPMFFSEGSIGGDIEQIPLKGIKAFYGEQRNAPRKAEIDDSEPSGSNGFAISGELTKSGNAMLLINPHTSFYFRGEVHVVSEEGLNAYGAVTWGQFFVYQGFNEKNGWMHTSTRADFIDEFIEDVFEENDKLYYTYGDEKRPMSVSSVTLKYRDGDKLSERTFPMYRTHHGPVTHMIDDKWVSTKINWDPVNALQQSYIRTTTINHGEFREMMDIRTNSSNNTVYADADGTIAYYHGNFMPKRDPSFDYSQPVDGSDPRTDWQGLHTVDESISIVNPKNGWIQNANSTPFTAAAEYSPKREDYPTYMAPDAENFRGVHGIQVLAGKSGFTLDSLIEAAYDPYLPGFEALIPGLVEAYDRASEKDEAIQGAIDVLRDWDYRVTVDSVAMTLSHFYGMNYRAQGQSPEGLSGMQRLTYFGHQSPDEERLAIFKQTVEQVANDFGQWSTPWGEVNRLQRLSGDIKAGFDDAKPSLPVGLASGRWGALAAYGSRAGENTKKLYGYRGNSFVAVVEFGDKVVAKTLLAGGQSGDPDSPHFYDQAQRYVEHQFKDVPYYREDVEKRAVRRYSPGQ
ncbi:acylase [Alteromonadaceae bacterium M269]|nr:acylase [Alteromonadaceae bacterium M269]